MQLSIIRDPYGKQILITFVVRMRDGYELRMTERWLLINRPHQSLDIKNLEALNLLKPLYLKIYD